MTYKEIILDYLIPILIIIIFILALALIGCLTYKPDGFENTPGSRLEDIINFGGINQNYGYQLISRLPNVKRFTETSINRYQPDNELFQMLILNKGGPSNELIYVVPMNITGKSSKEYTYMISGNNLYPSFEFDRMTSLISGSNAKAKKAYFYIDGNNNTDEDLRSQNIIFKQDNTTTPITSYPLKYSKWECGTLDKIDYLKTHSPPGYKFSRIQNHKQAGLKTAPNVGAICFGDFKDPIDRVRGIYIHK